MKTKIFTALGLCTALLTAPVVTTQAQEKLTPPEAATDIDPNIVGGGIAEVYPLVVDNVAGFSSLLMMSNLLESGGQFTICTVPQGAQGFICRGETFGPLQTKFFTMPTLGITNTTGQMQIFAGQNSFGASTLLIQDQQGNFTLLPPLQF